MRRTYMLFASTILMSQTTTETGNSPLATGEAIANTLVGAAAAAGVPDAAIAGAALTGAEVVGNAVEAAIAAHSTAVQDASAALKTIIATAPTVAAAVSPEVGAQVTAAAAHAGGILGAFEDLLAAFGIKI
jgi:hypothetical protein